MKYSVTAGDLALELIETTLEIASEIGQGYTGRWGTIGSPWYDHRFDWAQGPDCWMGLEPGVLGHFWMRLNDRVLDLCCGDGMFAGLYFSKKASTVHGLDRNSEAVELATRLYGQEGVEFFQRDVLEDPFPLEEYDAVMWFQSIEHFSREDCVELIGKIKRHLHPEGFLFGSTVIGHKDGNPEHKLEFQVSQDLRELLETHFSEVKIWARRRSEKRTDLLFHCE